MTVLDMDDVFCGKKTKLNFMIFIRLKKQFKKISIFSSEGKLKT